MLLFLLQRIIRVAALTNLQIFEPIKIIINDRPNDHYLSDNSPPHH
jgi:hypothetical protein